MISTLACTVATRSVEVDATVTLATVVDASFTLSERPSTKLRKVPFEDDARIELFEAVDAPYSSRASWALLVSLNDKPASEVSISNSPACPEIWLESVKRNGLIEEPSFTMDALTSIPEPLIRVTRSRSESSASKSIVIVVEPSRTCVGVPFTSTVLAEPIR